MSTATVDVSSREPVHALAAKAAGLGDVVGLIHAAGVSPSHAAPETILRGSLRYRRRARGVLPRDRARWLRRRHLVAVRPSLPALTIERNKALVTTPADGLLKLDFLQPDQVKHSLHTYQLSKRGNSLRVMGEAVEWGKRGARINTISPGIVMTPLAKDELTGPRGEPYRRMIEGSVAKRAVLEPADTALDLACSDITSL